MRKAVILLVLLITIGSAGAYVYLKLPLQPEKDVASVLPADTVALVRVCELKKQIQRFKTGKMGRSLAAIDLPALMTAMEVSQSRQKDILAQLEHIKRTINSTWFNALFGQDIAIALQQMTSDPARPVPDHRQVLRDAVTIVARPTQQTMVLESLNTMFAGPLSVETQPYKSWEINHLKGQNGETVYYALTEGWLIAGFSAAPVKRSLDQSLNEATSLLHQPVYRKYCASLYKAGRTDMVIFVQADAAIKTLTTLAESESVNVLRTASLKQQIAQLQGIESINSVAYDDGSPLISLKTIIGIDRKRLSPMLLRTTSVAPSANPTLKRVPADAILYGWQNNFDLPLYWQQLKENPEITSETIAQIEQTVQARTGMPMEKLLAAVGTQAGLLINNIDTKGLLPIPELALFLEVNQTDVIDRVIRDQIGQIDLPLRSEPHDKAMIRYLTLPLGNSLSPAYTITDGFCTVAVNPDLIKSMLKADSLTPLTESPDFKALGQGLSDENNQMFYIQNEMLLAKSRGILTWSMTWLSLTQPKEARKIKEIFALGVYPVLDGLTMVKTVGGRAYTDKDRITSEINILLDRT